MFASNVKKQVEIQDGDSLVSVTIRKLSARILTKAAETRQRQSMAASKELGGELIKVFREDAQQKAGVASDEKKPEELSSEEKAKAAEDKREAQYALYDRDEILTKGIDSWTAPVKVKDGVEDLDEETAEKLHREILDMSLPPLDVEGELVKG